MNKLSEYMHTAEAAEYLGVHHNTLRKWATLSGIPMRRNPMNGYRLFKRSDPDRFLRMTGKLVMPKARASN
jgi:excisionase family DNA binding protein